jgi:hypothetical protein
MSIFIIVEQISVESNQSTGKKYGFSIIKNVDDK